MTCYSLTKRIHPPPMTTLESLLLFPMNIQKSNKYWHILISDPTIGPFVPPTPLVTFRRATSVGDMLVKSELKGSTRGDPCKVMSTFPRGSCAYCRYMDTRKNVQLPNGWTFISKHFANCQTTDLGCYYIGKTIQKLWKKIYCHISAMKTSNPDLPLGRHGAQVHNGHSPELHSCCWTEYIRTPEEVILIRSSCSMSSDGSWT